MPAGSQASIMHERYPAKGASVVEADPLWCGLIVPHAVGWFMRSRTAIPGWGVAPMARWRGRPLADLPAIALS